MTGMQGVYLVATELTKRGLVVSPTSRSTFGADLLVTDQKCKHAWSVQVKTNFDRRKFWLLSEHACEVTSDTHIYVLVNLGQKNPQQMESPPDFYVVPGRVVARRKVKTPPRGSLPAIEQPKIIEFKNRWELFGKHVQ
jgi:hypothetical protein